MRPVLNPRLRNYYFCDCGINLLVIRFVLSETFLVNVFVNS